MRRVSSSFGMIFSSELLCSASSGHVGDELPNLFFGDWGESRSIDAWIWRAASAAVRRGQIALEHDKGPRGRRDGDVIIKRGRLRDRDPLMPLVPEESAHQRRLAFHGRSQDLHIAGP